MSGLKTGKKFTVKWKKINKNLSKIVVKALNFM